MKDFFKGAGLLPEKLFCRKGFTLLEVLLSVTIFSLLLSALFMFYGGALQGWSRDSAAMDLQQNARIAVYEITRELRYASAVEGLSDRSILPLYDGDEGGRQRGAGLIAYTSSEGQKSEIAFNKEKRTVTLRIGKGPPNELAYNVAGMDFFCYFPQPVAGGSEPEGRCPMILFRLKVQGEGQELAPGGSYILQSSLRLQNISYK